MPKSRVARACVLQVLPSLEGGGGVERGTVDMALAIQQEGMTSCVACAAGKTATELSRQGVIHIPMGLNRKNPWALLRHIFALKRCIKDHRVDILHVRSRAPAWSAFFAARWARVPLVTTFHSRYSGSRSFIKRQYNRIMLRARDVIAVSPFIARHIADRYRVADDTALHIIERGVDTVLFDPDKVDEKRVQALREKWKIEPQHKVILLAGRISSWKGHHWFLESLAALQRHDIRAVLVGTVARHHRAERLSKLLRHLKIADRVVIAGHCSDMPAAYRVADIVVAPSLKPEAFGRVVAEALAMGRRVVGADHGGFQDIVTSRVGDPSRVGAFGVEPGNRHDLTRVLNQLLEQKGDDGSAAQRARKHIQDHFDLERMVTKTLRLYRHVHERAMKWRSRRHILVIRFGALGDIVRASGAMHSIRHHHPDDWITMLTTAPFVELVRNLGYFDHVWKCQRPSLWRPVCWWNLMGRIRRYRPDIVYDLQNSRSSRRIRTMLMGQSKDKSKDQSKDQGKDKSEDKSKDQGKDKSKEIIWHGENQQSKRRRTMHALQRHQTQLMECGVKKIFAPDLSMLQADLRHFELSSPYVLMVPSASKEEKCWPVERYGHIAREFSQQGLQTILIGSEKDQRRNRGILESISGNVLPGKILPRNVLPRNVLPRNVLPRNVLNMTGQTTLSQLAALGTHAFAALGSDSGPMHIFAVVGCPCLVLGSDRYMPHVSVPRGHVRLLSAPRIAKITLSAVQREWMDLVKGRNFAGTRTR